MMPILNFRMPPKLWAAAEGRAAECGLTIRNYARKLIEEDTGIAVEVKHGLAGSSDETRSRVGSLGGIAKARSGKKSKGRAKKLKDNSGEKPTVLEAPRGGLAQPRQ